jgi:hypothetical protein
MQLTNDGRGEPASFDQHMRTGHMYIHHNVYVQGRLVPNNQHFDAEGTIRELLTRLCEQGLAGDPASFNQHTGPINQFIYLNLYLDGRPNPDDQHPHEQEGQQSAQQQSTQQQPLQQPLQQPMALTLPPPAPRSS